MTITAKEVAKAVTTAVGVVAMAVSSGFLHGTALTVADAILAVATTYGVYKVPNAPAKGTQVVPAPTGMTNPPSTS
jgi:hypothetical protein